MKMLELIIERWPEFAFMVIVLFFATIAFRIFITQVLSEYRSLLSQYKERNEVFSNEIDSLQKKYDETCRKYSSLEIELIGNRELIESLNRKNSDILKNHNEFKLKYETLEEKHASLHEKQSIILEKLEKSEYEVKEWEKALTSFKKQLDVKIDKISDIKHETKALFSERDKLSHDLKLVWDVLLRFSVFDPKVKEAVETAREKKQA